MVGRPVGTAALPVAASAAGKSHLLAWLFLACTTPGTPIGQRVHAVLPADGVGVRGAAWSLGQQLGLLAHDPEELVAALAADDRRTVLCVPELDRAVDPVRLVTGLLLPMLELPQVRLIVEAGADGPAAAALGDPAAAAVLDLDDPQWTDRQRFTAWCAKRGADAGAYPSPGRALGPTERSEPAGVVDLAGQGADVPDGRLDLLAAGEELLTEVWTAIARAGDSGPPSPALSLLADPLLAVLARPLAVAAALEAREGMLGTRARPSRGPGTPPAPRWWTSPTPPSGPPCCAPACWAWTTPPRPCWPKRPECRPPGPPVGPAGGTCPRWTSGPARPSRRPATGCGVRAAPRPASCSPIRAASCGCTRPPTAVASVPSRWRTPGRCAASPWPPTVRSCCSTPGARSRWCPVANRDQGSRRCVRRLTAVRAAAGGALSAVAAVHGLEPPPVGFGDDDGAVHWCEDAEDPDGIRSVRLHSGPVTALAATLLGGGEGDDTGEGDDADPGFPLLVSGGLDGAVRLWGPDSVPMAEPSDQRACPVTAVAVAVLDAPRAGLTVAAAWSDGLVRVRHLDDPDGVVELRLGSRVESMALAADGLLVLGLPDGVVAIDL